MSAKSLLVCVLIYAKKAHVISLVCICSDYAERQGKKRQQAPVCHKVEALHRNMVVGVVGDIIEGHEYHS